MQLLLQHPLQAVYFKLRFSLSYRDIEELLRIRGVVVDHATIQRWVIKFTPMIDINFRKRKKKPGMRWRQCKYLNNIVEQDHRFVKWRTKNMLGFKSFESAQITLSGIETVRMIKKDQLINPRITPFHSFCSLAG